MENEIKKYKTSSRRKTKWILSSFLVILALYITFLLWAIYDYYTWDIMEPIVYFIDYFVFLLMLSSFFYTKKGFSHQRLRQTIYQWLLKRNLRRNGFNVGEYTLLKNRLDNMHKFHANKLFNDRF
jgi:small-conductance mechanosensitive channel